MVSYLLALGLTFFFPLLSERFSVCLSFVYLETMSTFKNSSQTCTTYTLFPTPPLSLSLSPPNQSQTPSLSSVHHLQHKVVQLDRPVQGQGQEAFSSLGTDSAQSREAQKHLGKAALVVGVPVEHVATQAVQDARLEVQNPDLVLDSSRI